MSSLIIRNARIVTPAPTSAGRPLRGAAMNRLEILPRADVRITAGTIADITPCGAAPSRVGPGEIDADGRVLMPAFVDCHTHACFAGDRLDEWALKLAGTPYHDILRSGGGIQSSVRAVRAATQRQLADLLRERLQRMVELGSGAIEVKSGYGLSTAEEVKMLGAIRDAAVGSPATIVPTALLGHALDPDLPRDRFVRTTIEETLPEVVRQFGPIAVDAFVEDGAWTLEEGVKLLDAAKELGCPCRLHADQFTHSGIAELNVRRHAAGRGLRSIDHLEATPADDFGALARTDTIAVLLPCTGLHTDRRYADGRGLIRAGSGVAVATNFNPGTSPTCSMPMALAMAVRFNGLTPSEAMVAGTLNAASVLGLDDRGALARGRRADMILLRHRDERQLCYEFGDNPCDVVILGGVVTFVRRGR